MNKYITLCVVVLHLTICAKGQLTPDFYASSCPNALDIVRNGVLNALQTDTTLAGGLLRLHFHDCFVNGCDASVLLDGNNGEKNAIPNRNSLRGFEAVDAIKTALEKECSGVVSCADILAIAARDSVVLSGGPTWNVLLGRRDSLVANKSGALVRLPGYFERVSAIKAKFAAVGLDISDVVALSGAHTLGRARCSSFTNRLYSSSKSTVIDPTLDSALAASLLALCPVKGDGNVITDLDQDSGKVFDNHYFTNLVSNKGLLTSDQELFSSYEGRLMTRDLVLAYSNDSGRFFTDFANSMIKMGNNAPLTGTAGQIRRNCRVVN